MSRKMHEKHETAMRKVIQNGITSVHYRYSEAEG